eukprot:scaffold8165_cov19-Prasinocladus_malaysianus.AAC.2
MSDLNLSPGLFGCPLVVSKTSLSYYYIGENGHAVQFRPKSPAAEHKWSTTSGLAVRPHKTAPTSSYDYGQSDHAISSSARGSDDHQHQPSQLDISALAVTTIYT